MTTKTLDATFEHGVIKPKVKLPFREHARLKLVIVSPTNPVRRTRGIFRVPKGQAKILIYDDTLCRSGFGA